MRAGPARRCGTDRNRRTPASVRVTRCLGYRRGTASRGARMPEHVDVLIVGAGISGIGAACHLVRESPGRSYAILERRERLGGTWDLFRYPGIRSDSDMFTFGFNFRPWNETKTLADGPSIRRYVADTAAQYG